MSTGEIQEPGEQVGQANSTAGISATIAPVAIPENATEDLPPEDQAQVAEVQLTDPEVEHRHGVEKSKLKFAFWLVGGSLVSFLALVTVDRYLAPTNSAAMPLSGAADLLKLLATTAIGYVFGRSVSNSKD